MKRNIILAITIVWALNNYCQNYAENDLSFKNHQRSQYLFTDIQSIPYQVDTNIKSIDFTKVYRNKKSQISKRTYDEKQQIIEFIRYDKKEKKNLQINSFYDEKGRYIKGVSNSKGKEKIRTEIEYNNQDKETLVLNYFNQKLTSKIEKKYNSEGLLIESSFYKGEKLKRKRQYLYYADNQLKETNLYNSKDKLIESWSYECKKEGEKLEKEKNLNQLCRWEETDKLFLTKVTQSFDEKGKSRKTILKFNIKDTSIVEYKSFDSDNKLKHYTKYDNSYSRPNLSISYDKNGEERFKSITTYSGNNITSYESYLKGKLLMKMKYDYDQNNLLKERRSYNKKDEVILTFLLAYNFY